MKIKNPNLLTTYPLSVITELGLNLRLQTTSKDLLEGSGIGSMFPK